MPVHKIEISQPAKRVLHTDITFSIHSDDTYLGELRVSKGTVDWRAPRARSAKQITWERFAKIMSEQ